MLKFGYEDETDSNRSVTHTYDGCEDEREEEDDRVLKSKQYVGGKIKNRILYVVDDAFIYTTNGDACVCVFAKLDQFLPVRSQFDSNQHVNSVRIATFQSANFGPLLFAFYCPLLFYENKIKNE